MFTSKFSFRVSLVVIFYAFLFLLPIAVSATTYYVDQQNASCSDAGLGTSESQPWCTLHRATDGRPSREQGGIAGTFAPVTAGDTVYVKNGTYTDITTTAENPTAKFNPANSGTAASPIAFRAYTPVTGSRHQPIVTRQLNSPAGSNNPAIGVNGRNYIIWDGFHLGPSTNVNIFSCTGCIAENLTIGPGTTGCAAGNFVGFFTQETNNLIVRNNLVHDLSYGPGPGGCDDSNNSGITLYEGHNAHVHNNEFYNLGNGIHDKENGLDNIHEFNYIHDIRNEGFSMFGFVTPRCTSTSCRVNNITIRQNIITNAPIGVRNGLSDPSLNGNISVYNNVMHNVDRGVGMVAALPGLRLYNNAITLRGMPNGTNAHYYYRSSGVSPDLLANYSNFRAPSAPYAGFSVNWIFESLAQWQARGFDLNSLIVDPQFVGPLTVPAGFQLQPSSLLRNAGRVGGVSAGAAVNMGAYVTGSEVIGTGSVVVPPPPPPPPPPPAVIPPPSSLPSSITPTPPPSSNLGAWVQLNPSTNPNPADGPAFVYDIESQRVIMFGDHNVTYTDQTWAFDVNINNWAPLALPVIHPSARAHAQYVYDSQSDRMILFGGQTMNNSTAGDTWVYDYNSNTWTNMNPASPPSGRWGAAAAYDSLHDRMLMYGGYFFQEDILWSYHYNTNTWENRNLTMSASCLASRPGPMQFQAMAYDSVNDKTLMAARNGSGTAAFQTWAYDYRSNCWQNRNAANQPNFGQVPYAAYDSQSQVMVVKDDYQNGAGGTYMYNYATNTWTHLSISPLPLTHHIGLAYVPNQDRIILYGGRSAQNASPSQTWQLTIDGTIPVSSSSADPVSPPALSPVQIPPPSSMPTLSPSPSSKDKPSTKLPVKPSVPLVSPTAVPSSSSNKLPTQPPTKPPAPLISPAPAPSPLSLPSPIATRVLLKTLVRGMRHAQVKLLQQFLIDNGYLDQGNVTGFFGVLTESAVKKFQCKQEIVCNGSVSKTGWGLVGIRTRTIINSLPGNLQKE